MPVAQSYRQVDGNSARPVVTPESSRLRRRLGWRRADPSAGPMVWSRTDRRPGHTGRERDLSVAVAHGKPYRQARESLDRYPHCHFRWSISTLRNHSLHVRLALLVINDQHRERIPRLLAENLGRSGSPARFVRNPRLAFPAQQAVTTEYVPARSAVLYPEGHRSGRSSQRARNQTCGRLMFVRLRGPARPFARGSRAGPSRNAVAAQCGTRSVARRSRGPAMTPTIPILSSKPSLRCSSDSELRREAGR